MNMVINIAYRLNTKCTHWIDTFCECELDIVTKHIVKYYCSKCVYEAECELNPINCTKYKCDTSDGGCYD